MKAKKDTSILSSITIDRDKIYRPDDVEKVLGTRCLQQLRNAGLVAIGNWYSGQSLLDSFERARHDRFCQRALAKGEEKNEKGTQKEEKDVVENCVKERVQPVPAPSNLDPLGSQLQTLRERRKVS